VDANGFAKIGTQSNLYDGTEIPQQHGVALLTLLMALVLLSCAILLDGPRQAPPARWQRDAITARSLADAKRAVIAWSVTLSPAAGKKIAPGLLLFPDRNRDGNYDGKGDCVTFGLNDSHLLGRLPWAGHATPCPNKALNIRVQDGAGEGLWYAVSRNLLSRGRGGPLNPDMGIPGRSAYPWITLRNAQGGVVRASASGEPLAIAAVIIAPGVPLGGQDRRGTSPEPAEFLDSFPVGAVTFDNADADGCPDAAKAPCAYSSSGEEFIVYPDAPAGGGFNDRLMYITVGELMRAVEKRVLGEAAIALTSYRDTFGAYPWLAGVASPKPGTAPAPASFKSNLARSGRLPVHLPGEVFATRLDASWNFIDSTPTTVTRHSGDVKLVPPLADAMSGSTQVSVDIGRCVWSDWSGGECTGSQMIPAYYRIDLGIPVTRTVEYSLAVVDKTPQVTPPTPGDVRRRTLSGAANTPTGYASPAWSIRITDDDGVNRGERETVIDADTGGQVTLSGIRYDLSVVYDDLIDSRDEVPEWFARNNWHHFIFAAFSEDAVAGGNADGDGDCSTPVNTCLILNASGKLARSDLRALVVSSGIPFPHQDRSIGDCDGDGVAEDFLCSYLEGDNSDTSSAVLADTYARGAFSSRFNDQLRIVDPLPP